MSSDLTPARLEELLAAASPGPWRHSLWHKTESLETWDVTVQEVEVAQCHWMPDDPVDTASVHANASLIALAPSLAARVIELEAALRACVQAHETGRYEPAQAAYQNARTALETPND